MRLCLGSRGQQTGHQFASRYCRLRTGRGDPRCRNDQEGLETQTDTLSAQVQMPKEFILPGETRGSGALSLARTVVRRAERRIAELLDAGELENQELLRYLNRLSSLCFVLELAENQFSKKETRKAKE
ncbi:MAG: ATP:cob(I)alamin adenosyltransferase [Anaerolineae bacterium]|nr:ATP:cob(I)alamin adenosyltransferase [Anaerolineae bacterium]